MKISQRKKKAFLTSTTLIPQFHQRSWKRFKSCMQLTSDCGGVSSNFTKNKNSLIWLKKSSPQFWLLEELWQEEQL